MANPIPEENQVASTHIGHPSADVVGFCDESGAKGYADQSESIEGETGVFAGFVVPRSDLPALRNDLRSVVNQLPKQTGKLHITDLPQEEQEALRQDIFAVLLRNKVSCFYDAIHVEGFHAEYKGQVALVERVKSLRKSKIKISNPLPKPDSLHVVLFFGFFSRVLGHCMKGGLTEVKIEVRTDRVDAPILKAFQKSIQDFLRDDARRVEVTGWNPESKSVVSGSIVIQPLRPGLPINADISFLASVADDEELILAADILANSLNHRFQNRSSNQKFLPLNCAEAISDHPLFPCLESYRPGFDFADLIYSHPKRPKPSSGG